MISNIKCFFEFHNWDYFRNSEENLKELDKKLLIGVSNYDSRVCGNCGKTQEIIGEYYSDWDRGYLWN